MAEPIRTDVAPNSKAVSKSELIPIDNFLILFFRQFCEAKQNALPLPHLWVVYTSDL